VEKSSLMFSTSSSSSFGATCANMFLLLVVEVVEILVIFSCAVAREVGVGELSVGRSSIVRLGRL
jgi:hypothetical protein